MSKQYAHLHAMAKTSVKFQNDWLKTVGGVALTSQLLTNGRTDKLCKTIVGPDHQCFIQRYQCKNNSSEDSDDEEDEEMKPEKSSRFIFFDFLNLPNKLVNIM